MSKGYQSKKGFNATLRHSGSGGSFNPSGSYEDLIAGDLVSMNDRVTVASKFVIRTTAGDESIDSGKDALLLEVVGGTDDNGTPFKIHSLQWNGANQLNPQRFIEALPNRGILREDIPMPGFYNDDTGEIVAPGMAKRCYIIRCPKCEAGEWGTAEKNNGYLLTDRKGNNLHVGDGTILGVWHCATLPAIGSEVTEVESHTFDGHDEVFYLPDEGYLLIGMAGETDASGISAHLAWSKDYNVFREFKAPVSLVVAVSELTAKFDTESIDGNTCLVLRGIESGNGGSYDRIVIYADGGGIYEHNNAQKLLTELAWAETEIEGEIVEGEGEATNGYRYTASLPTSGTYAALRDGLIRSDMEGMTLDGLTLVYDSAEQISPATAFAGKYVDYQMATPITGTHDIDPTGKPADDMGTEEVVGGDAATGTIVISYMRGFKDTMRALANAFKDLKDQFEESEYAKPLYFVGAWLDNAHTASPADQDNPDALAVMGNREWALDWRPGLVDMTAVEGETVKTGKELRKNNWLRDVYGNFAPVVGITVAMRDECMANALYTDAACTEQYCAAGAFDPVAFLKLCSIETVDGVKRMTHPTLYKAVDTEVGHYLKPWETTETKYGVFVGRKDEVYLLDNAVGASGKEWNGILGVNANVWDGMDVKTYALKPTGICPSPPTSIVEDGLNKLRPFFFNYPAADTYSKGNAGASGCTMFRENGHYRTNNISQIGTMTRARNNNHDTTSPLPVSEGGYHARNTFLRCVETAFGTKNLCIASRFGSGVSSVDACNSEATWKANGGMRYKAVGSDVWAYRAFSANPAIYYGTGETKSTTNASNWLSSYGPLSKTLEAQIAVSFAVEFGIAAGERFLFNGQEWRYENPTQTGTFAPKTVADGEMNCRVYKIVTGTFTGYASASATETTDYEIEVCVRTGLMLGCDMSGDGGPYWGGGCEIVGQCETSPASGSFGHELKVYVEPEQEQWVNESRYAINIGEKYAFEDKYALAGSIVTVANGYARRRLPHTPLPAALGASYQKGDCGYCYVQNNWGSAGKKTRVGVRLGSYAYNSTLSARYLVAAYSAGYTSTYYCSSAQVRWRLQ